MTSSDSLRSFQIGAAAAAASASAYLLYSHRKEASGAIQTPMASKYQGGEDYADPKVVATGLAEDLRSAGIKTSRQNLRTLLAVALSKGEPLDDKKLTTEHLIALLTSLPSTSKTRKLLTNKLIDTLWSNLQHPPLTYMGGDVTYSVPGQPSLLTQHPPDPLVQYTSPNGACQIVETPPVPPKGIFHFRTPDGSYNNILAPHLGKAGTPYAKSIRSDKKLQGVRPDPALLFDTLMARDYDNFKENPAGISSILFYHATIIIHDIFNTNRLDPNVSDTSSYLDLAPLYGSSIQDQLAIRTMEKGLLKPDTFHEKRLLGQPPGVNVMLVLYSRFHNYVADTLLKINEGGRFTLAKWTTKEEEAKAIAKQDNDLFNTARLIVGGLYINISLHDYLRAITNTHHSKSTWTLDPRVEIEKMFGDDGTPRGVGNQVSVEFNLLYRFHSAISKRDDKWTTEFFEGIFPNHKGRLDQLTPMELYIGLSEYEKKLPRDPSQRNFGDLKRGPDGRFKDEDLARTLREGIEDPAGSFGARQVPKVLRSIEILGILQARKWQVASLNEFRQFFGLKRHETMEDVNPNPEIADLLRNLYTHPDLVELYPGLFIEDIKPRMDTGCGICPPYSVGRAVLSDAVTLVRSDRFNTLDYNVGTLTNWGMTEVAYDEKTLGGSMLYKLIQRGLPGWFPYNSLHVMQPMFTKDMNRQIAKQFGTYKLYTEAGPSPPRLPVILSDYSKITKVLKDQKTFVVPWTPALNDMFPGEKDFSGYMLGGDKQANTAQRNLVGDIIYGVPGFKKLLSDFIANVGSSFLKAEAFQLNSSGLTQIDIIRDIAIPLNARLLADLFYLDLNTTENPNGSMDIPQFYKALLDIRIWGVNNNDPGIAWNRRRWASEAAQAITSSARELVRSVAADKASLGLFGIVTSLFTATRRTAVKEGSLRWCGKQIVEKLLAAGKSVEDVADILWLTAFGGIGVPVTYFAEILQFFLKPENQTHWAKVQSLAAGNTADTDKLLRDYVVEAQRLTSTQRNMRIATETTTIDGQKIEKGSAVICLLGLSGRDPSADPKIFPEPLKFSPGRPTETITSFSFGPHQCLGREVALTFLTGLIKLVAGLKNLRPAPGDMGQLKSVQVGTEKLYLNDSWSYLAPDPTTWKLHFDGVGKGIFQPPKIPVTAGQNLQDVSNQLIKNEEENQAAHGVPNGAPVESK